MTDAVLYEQEGGIVTLTLNRPETRNPISERDVVDGLVGALGRIGADPSVRVAILTGAGSAFSSGGDLRAMQTALEERARDPHATMAYYTQGIQRIPLAFEALDVPVIAAVNGPAIGAGTDLACMCDLRIAADTARFAESFVKIGIIPGDGGAWLLPRVVGWSKACEMALTGDAISAAEALACGLVSQVVPGPELMAASRRLAERIAVNPPQAVRATKRLLREGRFATLPSLLQLSATAQAIAHTSEEHREALARALARTSKG
ncbi:Enoyl-CoA hydratase/carnithine racemase [Methylobacterium sp. 174MFSha1.1]|uniref:crotonase/enoyl-CoA hydratase family protein n=1 Tax=Methylobacterium sp. 174MFSha1.1 TaxID=1502749 RepID=UPI0008F37D79|nr:crotonase/enoyl-CoA hydratase family protein [Methylobacterium sp. 174MFSha1.1]SFU48411.1 Enoyl-CoA hydratase/carnithine racemase [Methylobacterium sp. 174MFSha1.1]